MRVDREQARRIAVHAQLLDGSATGVLDTVRRLGRLQIDPIATVATPQRLVLWSRLGVAPNGWYRGNLEGIAPEDLAPLLRFRDKFSLTIASHVTAQSALQRRATGGGSTGEAPRPLSKTGNRSGSRRSPGLAETPAV